MRQLQADTDEIHAQGRRLSPHALKRSLAGDMRECGTNDRLVVVVREGSWSERIWELGEADTEKYDELYITRYAYFFVVPSNVIDRGPPN